MTAGRQFNNRAALSLPDLDVLEIDAMAAIPGKINEWSGVGTTLFNTAVNPQSGDVWVSNTEARNHIGRDGPISEQDMQAFTDFALQLSYPPNPHRAIDNKFTSDQFEGHRVYTSVFTSRDSTAGCNTCHILDPANGRFGSADDLIAVLGENSQDFKVPHFRNLYQKIGFSAVTAGYKFAGLVSANPPPLLIPINQCPESCSTQQ